MMKVIGSIILFFFSLICFGENFVAGQDYEIINNSTQVETTKATISVIEFFSFGCPWCYKLEPALNKWVSHQGQRIYYKKIPVVFNKDWEFYARAYYTVSALALYETMGPALFKAILDDKKPLNNKQAMVDFFTQHGIDNATAQSAFGYSPSIDLEVNSGQLLMTRYQIKAVPTLVINNRYKTDLQMAKTETRLFAILEFLVKQSEKKSVSRDKKA